ncbi:sulfurtransferase TusA family protein [Halorubrum sp. BV1]|uniref:sulfurtransferase TusA family protein n=1 Tax=Halorubrum sp. BV1 TaxID=1498500 RepID=UPI00067908AC|nr:sulfurtransferase TusA family protein [Halorubrum sp. BV1]
MSHPSWDDVVETPDELDDETAEALLEGATEVQDLTGEACPYPQVEAEKAVAGLSPADVLVQKTDCVPNSENVSKAVSDDATATVWKSGDGRCRSLLRKN